MADATYFVWRRSAMAIHGRADTNVSTAYLPETSVFQYNQNGNLTNDGVKAFFYDDENQLTRIMATNAWKSEFTYDGKMRRRIRKEYTWRNSAWALTNEVRYVYDGNLVLQERDANNLAKVTYARGKDLSGSLEGAGGIGGLLARTENGQFTGGAGQAHAYYHADGNGNVTMLINTQQVAVAKYLYDPFGNTLSQSGALAEANLHRFSSKEWHQNSGTVYYLYRYYGPASQRWQTSDPMHELGFGLLEVRGGSLTRGNDNLYAFVLNDPVSGVDPFGLIKWGKNCTPDQKKQIEKGKKDLCDKARKNQCFRCLTKNQKKKMEDFCDGKGKEETYECDNAQTNSDCSKDCGNAFPGSYVIHICFNNQGTPSCPGGVGCTVLHEAVHAITQIKGNEVQPYGIEKCAGCPIPPGQPVPPGY